VYKKLLSSFGLALVVMITAIAAGMPPVGQDASATDTDIKISLRVTASAEAEITSPAEGIVFYDGNLSGATVRHVGAESLEWRLITPGGGIIVIYSFDSELGEPDTATIPLASLLTTYGTYILEVDGYSLAKNYFSGDATSFDFHAITVGSSSTNDTIRVNFGPATCQLGVKVFTENDTGFENPLIEHLVTDLSIYPGHPNYADVKIPGFADLDANQEYVVVVSAFECGTGSLLEEATFVVDGIMGPPKTGLFTLFGSGISHVDYLITGLIAFFAVAFLALFIIRRGKKDERRRQGRPSYR